MPTTTAAASQRMCQGLGAVTPEDILESLSDACFAVDRAWRLSYVNAAAELALGRSRSEILGTVYWETFPEVRGTSFGQSYVDAMASGVAATCEDYFAPDDRWYSAHVYPNPGGLTVFVRDVTTRERAVRAFDALREQFARVVETSPGGVVVLDAAGQVTFANAAAEQILGLSRSAAEGRAYDDPRWRIVTVDGGPFPPEDLPFARVRASGTAVHDLRHAIERDDGTRVVLSINAAPLLDAHGRFTGMVASLHDVTAEHLAERARARTEEQLRQAQRLETIGKLASGIAHDFNNILTAALSYVELARDGLDDNAPVRADLDEVTAALKRAGVLTRQLLAFGSNRERRARRLSLNVVIHEIRRMLGRLLGEDVALDLDLAPDLAWINADVGQIEQVIVNLAVNARDAMPGGGRITLATRNVSADSAEIDTAGLDWRSYVALEIRDTGCGMDEATLGRVFEPFFTTKAPGRGTGLGLATVLGIVERSGGVIRIESTPGRGTAVRVYLPTADGRAGGVRTDPPPPLVQGVKAGVVLIAEDEDGVRRSIARLLTDRGFSVLEADCGRGALDLLAGGERVDLLLCDFVLPDFDGRQLVARLEPQHRPRHVLFMSGYDDDALRRHGGFPEGTSFIEKPFHPDALVAKLQQVLDES